MCRFSGGAWREREAYEFRAESGHIGPDDPDGHRSLQRGVQPALAFWREWFSRNTDAVFEAEDVIVSGDRAVVRWVYRKLRNGQPWHLRGVDVFTVRGERVAAKLAYVKG